MLKVEVVTDIHDRSLLAEWDDLLAVAAWASPFQTPAWVCAWWRHFGGVREPHVVAARDGKDLVGLYPLYRTAWLWRSLRSMGTGQSDYLHPLVRRGQEASFQESLLSHLGSLKEVDLADLHQVREGSGVTFPAAAPVDQATCLTLDLPDCYQSLLGTLSKSLRFDCRRLEKEPFTSGAARIADVPPEDTRRAIEVFIHLHERRWRKRGLPGAFATRPLKEFHSDAAQALADAGQLRLATMVVDGSPVGVIYAMQVNQTRYFYQCGFDPQYKALSPGTLLVANSILTSIDEGCTVFDFLRGDEPYKRRWNPQHSHRNMRYILPLNPGLGAVGKSINHGASKIESKVRARLEGRGLFG